MFFECRKIDTLFNKNSKISEQVSRSISSTWSTFWLISLTLWKINALKRTLLHLSSTNVSSMKYGEDSMRNKMWRVIRARESTWKQLVKVFLSFRASCWESSKTEWKRTSSVTSPLVSATNVSYLTLTYRVPLTSGKTSQKISKYFWYRYLEKGQVRISHAGELEASISHFGNIDLLEKVILCLC